MKSVCWFLLEFPVKWVKFGGVFYVIELHLFFFKITLQAKSNICICALDGQDPWPTAGLFWLNQSPLGNSPSHLKDNHEHSRHWTLVLCSTPSPRIKCTHRGGADTHYNLCQSHCAVRQLGKMLRCGDHSSLALRNMCLYVHMLGVLQPQGVCTCSLRSVFLNKDATDIFVGPIFIVRGCPVHGRTWSFLGSIN